MGTTGCSHAGLRTDFPGGLISAPVNLRLAHCGKKVIKTSKVNRKYWTIITLLTLVASLPFGCRNFYPLPAGTSVAGEPQPASEVRFFSDQTWSDTEGKRHVEQEIFDRIFANIDAARKLILIDMFLFNDMQGPVREETRALTWELTNKLINHQQLWPETNIIVITDPVNTVYGGRHAEHLDALQAAGIKVILSPLDVLRDSNPGYSYVWRLLFRWMGNEDNGGKLPNPFGGGTVTFRSYLKLLNFKANHRKVVITDRGPNLIGFVTSANPHDGSSAHRNVALEFNGRAVNNLLASELAVLKLAETEIEVDWDAPDLGDTAATIQVLTESKIRDALIEAIDSAASDEQIDIQVFYLSERQIIRALKTAHQRGVVIRMILDPNKDAFGHKKNGIPNRQVAHELQRSGIPIRWCDTGGEQCHEKMLIWHGADGQSSIILGSANFTRRNLDDLNLETDVKFSAQRSHEAIQAAQAHFDESWNNTGLRQITADYEKYADRSLLKTWLYRFMEFSGWSTF